MLNLFHVQDFYAIYLIETHFYTFINGMHFMQ